MIYKKKVKTIEAVQFQNSEYADNPFTFDETPAWLQEAIDDKTITPYFGGEDYWYLKIESNNNVTMVMPDDFIIKNEDGTIQSLKAEEFESNYEKSN